MFIVCLLLRLRHINSLAMIPSQAFVVYRSEQFFFSNIEKRILCLHEIISRIFEYRIMG